MRYVAFPSSEYRKPLRLENIDIDYEIIVGPTESGLYIIEASELSIGSIREVFDEYYVFIEDFD